MSISAKLMLIVILGAIVGACANEAVPVSEGREEFADTEGGDEVGSDGVRVVRSTFIAPNGLPMAGGLVYIPTSSNYESTVPVYEALSCGIPDEPACASGCTGDDGFIDLDISGCRGIGTQLVVKYNSDKLAYDITCLGDRLCELGEIRTYALSYDGNGNLSGIVPQREFIYAEGQSVAVDANEGGLVKDGYYFAGWNSQADGQGVDYAQRQHLKVGRDSITFFARWIEADLLQDALSELTILTLDDAEAQRSRLRMGVWGVEKLPLDKARREVLTGGQDFVPAEAVVEMLFYEMDGFKYRSYLVSAGKATRKLFILHEGHTFHFNNAVEVVPVLLAAGYDVLIHAMPLFGDNTGPVLDHDEIIETLAYPLRYFFEPVVVSINTLDNDYDDIRMTGISGGAYTTAHVAALDTRISHSYPLDGITARYAYELDNLFVDGEQMMPIHDGVPQMDIFALGAMPGGRSQVLMSIYDSASSFGGDRADFYGPVVQQIVAQLGGSWLWYIDRTIAGHSYSGDTLRILLEDD